MSEKTVWLDPYRRSVEASGVDLDDQFEADSIRVEDIWDYDRGQPISGWGYAASGDLLALIHKHGAKMAGQAEMWDALQAVAKVADHGHLPRDLRGYWARAGARTIQREIRSALGDFA